MPRPSHFTPGKYPVAIVLEAEWNPGPVWTCAENLALIGIRSHTVQPVAKHYTDCTITAHTMLWDKLQNIIPFTTPKNK